MQLANKESMDGRSEMYGTKKTLLHARMRTRELLNRGVQRARDSVAWQVKRRESRAHEKTAGASTLLGKDVCYDRAPLSCSINTRASTPYQFAIHAS